MSDKKKQGGGSLNPPSIEEINAQGQAILESIVNDPGALIQVDERGRSIVTAPDGRGAWYKPDGSLSGFLEPENAGRPEKIQIENYLSKEDRPFQILVGSASEYEDLMASILFPGNFGLIVSQEKEEGSFEVSFHSFPADIAADFDWTRNLNNKKVALSDVQCALNIAVHELNRLKRVPSID